MYANSIVKVACPVIKIKFYDILTIGLLPITKTIGLMMIHPERNLKPLLGCLFSIVYFLHS